MQVPERIYHLGLSQQRREAIAFLNRTVMFIIPLQPIVCATVNLLMRYIKFPADDKSF